MAPPTTGLHTGFFFWGGRSDLTDDLRMYMRRCYAYILVNKSHNNAVITNFFFLLVYVIILFVLYILHVYYYGILGGGGGGGGGNSSWGGGGGDPSAPPPPPPPSVCNPALSQTARWLPKRWKESSSRRFDGKEQKDKRVYRSLVYKIEERSDWRVFSVQLPCLPSCNYGNGSISWTINVSYTADFFEP